MPSEFGVDYDWEHSGAQMVTPTVSCVSLGCWCGVAAALNHLKLRDAAFPFDWNRQSMKGILHFCSTNFADFLHLPEVKPFPESKSSGGKMWQGAHHSVWHEDLSVADGIEKYARRIGRFLQNPARTLLFIRALNSNTEVVEGENLLRVLSALFPKSRVYLLLIADCQLEARRFAVDSTDGRLLVHCIDHSKLGTVEYGGTYPVYHEAIRLAYKHATGCSIPADPDGETNPKQLQSLVSGLVSEWFQTKCPKSMDLDSMPLLRTRSCVELFPHLAPFFGGLPQEVPFNPTPIPAPKFPPNVSWQGLKSSSSSPNPSAVPLPAQCPNDSLRQWQQARQLLPRSATPRSVTPQSVTPRSVTPQSVTPRSVTPRSVSQVQLQMLRPTLLSRLSYLQQGDSLKTAGGHTIVEHANHSNKPGLICLHSRNPTMTLMAKA
mmetsp:Transcript_66164/g.115302  ORF Transcript_66164/g.115302 Transcript_66164/m.115302 type:complete len:434 (+) Transcript_66164:66-1367(+)